MKYRDNRGRTVTVLNTENNIAVLNNGDRVAVARLNDPQYYTLLEGATTPPPSQKTSSQTPSQTPSQTATLNPVMESNTNINMMQQTPNNLLNMMDDSSRYERLAKSVGNNNPVDISIGDVGDQTQLVGYSENAPDTQISMGGSVVESHNENLAKVGRAPSEEIVPVVQAHQPHVKTPPVAEPNHNANLGVAPEMTPEEILLAKYNNNAVQQNAVNSANKLAQLAGIEPAPVPTPSAPPPVPTQQTTQNVGTQTQTEQVQPPQPPPQPIPQSPLKLVCDSAKKTHPLKVSLQLNEKIPDRELLKILDSGFEESAVDYFAKDIFNKLMQNPEIIEKQVREAIKKYMRSRK